MKGYSIEMVSLLPNQDKWWGDAMYEYTQKIFKLLSLVLLCMCTSNSPSIVERFWNSYIWEYNMQTLTLQQKQILNKNKPT